MDIRFVRTKSGKIYDVSEYLVSRIYETITKEEVLGILGLKEKDVLSISDNVCDLFDEYVVGDKHPVVLSPNRYVIKGRMPHLFGAIWTEWGLRFVAKRNDYGIWELI